MNFKLMNTKSAPIILAVLMANSLPVQAGTVTLTGSTTNTCASYIGFSADANGNLNITCSGETEQTPTVAPSCTLTASPSSISAGASTMLIANCSPAATSYIWTGINFTGSGGNVSPVSTTTYSVTGINSVGNGNTATREITVTAASQQPPPSTTPGTRTVPPTSSDPLSVIREWNYAFETINYIPHNAKVEPIGTMAYYKLIQAGKPAQFHLPNPW